ncbi:MAG: transcription antitermination factor NusB [Clostridia bacterium]|nr:transcription antitermination factor NusB [Clostridia bacterium]
MNRHQARELAFSLLFEHEFDKERSARELYDTAKAAREEEENKYVRGVLTGVLDHEAELEAAISDASKGWSLSRISKVSLSILKLCAYEMLFCKDIPIRVSLNEAIELVKRYDEESARSFVNGILNTLAIRAREDRPDEQ